MNIKKTGQFIQMMRKERNLTQKQLAEKLGCTDKAVSRWETGAGLPDVAILLELSQVLGVSVNEILTGERLLIESLPTIIQEQNTEKENIHPKNELEIATAQIISAADITVVNVLKDSEVKLKKKNRTVVVFFCLCLIQLLCIFALPQIVSFVFPTFEPVLLLLYPTVLLCIAAGFIPDKIKWLYPLFLSVSFFVPIPFSGNEGHVYLSIGMYALVIAFLIVAVCHGVMLLVKHIKKSEI